MVPGARPSWASCAITCHSADVWPRFEGPAAHSGHSSARLPGQARFSPSLHAPPTRPSLRQDPPARKAHCHPVQSLQELPSHRDLQLRARPRGGPVAGGGSWPQCPVGTTQHQELPEAPQKAEARPWPKGNSRLIPVWSGARRQVTQSTQGFPSTWSRAAPGASHARDPHQCRLERSEAPTCPPTLPARCLRGWGPWGLISASCTQGRPARRPGEGSLLSTHPGTWAQSQQVPPFLLLLQPQCQAPGCYLCPTEGLATWRGHRAPRLCLSFPNCSARWGLPPCSPSVP